MSILHYVLLLSLLVVGVLSYRGQPLDQGTSRYTLQWKLFNSSELNAKMMAPMKPEKMKNQPRYQRVTITCPICVDQAG